MSLQLFNPTPEAAAQIRDRLTCPNSTLSGIAAQYETTLDALCLWIASDEVQEHLRLSEDAAAQRTRLTASHRMPFAIDALVEMLAAYTHAERKIPMTASLAHVECRERQRNNARRAAFLLNKLTRFYAPTPPSPRSPGPGHAGSRSADARRGDEGREPTVRRVQPSPHLAINSATNPVIDTAAESLPVLAQDPQQDQQDLQQVAAPAPQLAPPTPAMDPEFFTHIVTRTPVPAAADPDRADIPTRSVFTTSILNPREPDAAYSRATLELQQRAGLAANRHAATPADSS